MTIDIIMVSYNSAKYINKCIESIVKSDYALKNVGLYVYDNNSTDNSVELLKKLKDKYDGRLSDFQIFSGAKNYGFGIANNKAAKNAKSEYLFFLNIDCEIYTDTLSKISKKISNCSDEKIGIFELRQEIFEHPKYYDPITGYTKWSSGACFVMKRDLFNSIGGFDKNIFLYCEDVELSYRLRKNGYKLKYFNDVSIIHYSYSKPYEFKKSQFVNSVPNNLYLRLKYGNFKQLIKGVGLYLFFLKEIPSNNDIPVDIRSSIRKEIKRNARKMIFKGLIEYVKRIKYIFSKNKITFDFVGFDYGASKEGPFYQIKKTNSKPLVSIIVRTCNRPDVLRETLISIKNQTYKNIEVIVVEDGKMESKKMIDDEFNDLNIKYYSFGKNVGRCKAGNKALSMATGKYLNFLDDDDLFYNDHVEVLVGELENSDEKVAYTTAFETPIIVESKKPYKYKILSEYINVSNDFNLLKLFYCNITPIQSVMFDRCVYEKCGGFDVELDALEDWDLWIRYALEFPFKYVMRTTSIYRVPGDKNLALERGKVLTSYLEKVRNKHCKATIKTNMSEIENFVGYITFLNNTPFRARIDKIKKILRRNKK